MNELETLKSQREWIENYIPKLQLEDIEWIILDDLEMQKFLETNYFNLEEFIGTKNEYPLEYIPFGLTNTVLGLNRHGSKYLISYLKNQTGLKTILTCCCYYENFQTIELDLMITFILYVETNSFYQHQGLFKLTIQKFFELTSFHDYILITPPSSDGVLCHTFEYIKKYANDKGILVFKNIYDLKFNYLTNNKKLIK